MSTVSAWSSRVWAVATASTCPVIREAKKAYRSSRAVSSIPRFEARADSNTSQRRTVELHIVGIREFSDKFFVSIRFFRTQAVVHVGNREHEAVLGGSLQQCQKECDGIGPSGNRNSNTHTWAEKTHVQRNCGGMGHRFHPKVKWPSLQKWPV